MNREEAKEYAKNMSYRDAVYNALQGRGIPYRKATTIKLNELLDMLEPNTIFEIIESGSDYEGGNNLWQVNPETQDRGSQQKY